MKVSLPAFENARILVIGDVMLDRYWVGPTGRISPEAPVSLVGYTNAGKSTLFNSLTSSDV
ncbi:GTPase, partial [Shewanella sp.]|uniref:GTPase n=1 Tax=Shewanella sp. TaxID=50422 RepID=UPI004048BB74